MLASQFLDQSAVTIARWAEDWYPGEPQEIDWFVQMMKKAAPKMSEADLETIEAALRSFKRT